MTSTRKAAVVAGVFFLVTEVAAIAGLLLYGPALHGAEYVAGDGADRRVALGAVCEVVLLVGVIGTAVALFPVLRRRHEALALGYVCGRLLEAAVIAVGIIGVLSVLTLRQDAAGTPGAGAAAAAMVAVHDRAFLLGPDIVLGVNSLLLALLLHRSRLVPRAVTVLGLVGGPLICASAVAVLFGVYPQVSTPGSLAALPVFAWELALAFRLITKGLAEHPDPADEAAELPAAVVRAAGPVRQPVVPVART
ncbi:MULTISPECIES: DUF4386 domain-containing protein [unclassified Kitasatospora]|uniref:DUF4386 domain-containing protein n=1 Tax=unclassified Kitasatospora TaxID=2633591 RepID=UPI001AE0634F|nr:DUF4386 domain-containing protein [Kitasatospora sp. RG8]MBP0450078.1 DUF4386 domain-containing protein [Kitasatospora sp. RG8]